MTTPIDWRGLCEKLTSLVERCPVTSDTDWIAERNELIVQVHGARRAALAQPQPEVVGPDTDSILALAAIIRAVDGNHSLGAAALAEAILSHPGSCWRCAALAQPEAEVVGLSDEELLKLAEQAAHIDDGCLADAMAEGYPLELGAFDILEICRAVLARWGRPAPAPAGEVAELVEWLRDHAYVLNPSAERKARRICDLLERLASPACLVLDPSPEVLAALKAAGPGRIELLPEDAQVIEPTERTILVPVPVPVPVSERPWDREGWCDEQGQCWMGDPGGGGFIPSWRLCRPEDAPNMKVSLPFNALPLPSSSSTH